MPLSALAAASALASSGTQRDEPSSAHQRSSIAQIGAGTGAPHFGTRVTPSIPAPQYLQWSPASANFHDTLPQSLSPRSLGSADQRQRTGSAEAQHHQPQQHIMPQHAPHPLYGSHYTYPASSSRTPAHYTATPSGVPAQAYGNYTHSFPTSYPLTTSVSSSGIARSSALQQQPSLLPLSADQSSASNRVWFDQSSPNTRNLFSPPIAGSPALASADSATAEESAQSTSKRCGDDTHVADPRRQERASTSERSYTPGSSNNLSVRVVSPKEKHSGLSSPRKHHATSGDTLLSDEEEEYVDEGDEDEEDQLVDDDCVDGDLMSNVLSNPLRLLAQASDAAAARIEAGPNSIAAAETMGLITPSLTKSSTTSALGGVARAVESERRSAVSTGSGSPQNQRSSRPPLLGSIGRSRSYPARQPVVTSSDKAAQAQKSNSSSSTLHNSDQWEYREGRARARRETHSGAQDGGGNATSSGSNTTGAETSAAGPAAPDSVLGKRRRSRSRKGGRRSSRRRETRKEGAATREAQQGENAAPGEQEAGASRKGYFNLSLFHSKLDDDPALDPVDLGMLDQKEVEKLFDM